jgi:hypothetical protein
MIWMMMVFTELVIYIFVDKAQQNQGPKPHLSLGPGIEAPIKQRQTLLDLSESTKSVQPAKAGSNSACIAARIRFFWYPDQSVFQQLSTHISFICVRVGSISNSSTHTPAKTTRLVSGTRKLTYPLFCPRSFVVGPIQRAWGFQKQVLVWVGLSF